jgi:hypothetical protein
MASAIIGAVVISEAGVKSVLTTGTASLIKPRRRFSVSSMRLAKKISILVALGTTLFCRSA